MKVGIVVPYSWSFGGGVVDVIFSGAVGSIRLITRRSTRCQLGAAPTSTMFEYQVLKSPMTTMSNGAPALPVPTPLAA